MASIHDEGRRAREETMQNVDPTATQGASGSDDSDDPRAKVCVSGAEFFFFFTAQESTVPPRLLLRRVHPLIAMQMHTGQ